MTATPDSPAEPAPSAAASPAPRDPLTTASLASLHVTGGDEPFDLCGCPHLLALARAVLLALSPPLDMGCGKREGARRAWCAWNMNAPIGALSSQLRRRVGRVDRRRRRGCSRC